MSIIKEIGEEIWNKEERIGREERSDKVPGRVGEMKKIWKETGGGWLGGGGVMRGTRLSSVPSQFQKILKIFNNKNISRSHDIIRRCLLHLIYNLIIKYFERTTIFLPFKIFIKN